jgi:hypothetical protein
MKLELNEQELQVLLGLIDAGVKAIGLNAAQGAAHLLMKITKAKEEAAKSTEE